MAKIEWKVWNMHKDWQPMKATTLDEAARELAAKGPYAEEAQIRIDGKVIDYHPPRQQPNFGPYGW